MNSFNSFQKECFGWRSILIVASVSLVLGATSLIYPFGRDQGIHAFIAYNFSQGQVVYRDIFNVKPPLTTLTHALALVLFGHSMTSIRILDLIMQILVGCLLGVLAWRIFRNRSIAIIAGIIYTYSYFSFGYWTLAQTDGWLSLPIVAALLILPDLSGNYTPSEDGRNNIASRWFIAGIFIGLAFLYKYTIGMIMPALALLAFCFGRNRLERLSMPLFFVMGFSVPIALAVLYLWHYAAISGFIDSQFKLAKVYAGVRLGEFVQLKLFVKLCRYFIPIISVLGFGGLILAVGKLIFYTKQTSAKTKFASALAILWLVSGIISVFVQGKFFYYQFLPVLAPLALLSCWILAEIVYPIYTWIDQRTPRLLIIVPAALCLIFLPPWPRKFQELGLIAAGKTELKTYWMAPLYIAPSFSLRDDLLLVDYLKQISAPKDRVYIWGFEPLVNFLARRDIVSRFEYSFPLVPISGLPQFREEFLRDFLADPPEFFVVQRGDATPWSTGHSKDSFTTFNEFDELNRFITKHYSQIHSLGSSNYGEAKAARFYVYERK